MKQCVVVLFSFFLLNSAFSSDEYISGDGRFVTKDTDSLEFIKNQLIHSALKDIISKEITNLGLDSKMFWDRYNTALEEHLLPIKEQLELRYNVGKPGQTNYQREQFQKVWRNKKFEVTSEFGQLRKSVRSFTIKRMSRSSRYPNIRYITMEAKISRDILKRVYFRFASEKTAYQVSKVYVSIDLGSKETSWAVFGVESKDVFLKALNTNIKNWLEKNMANQIEEVIISDIGQDETLEKVVMTDDVAASLAVHDVDNERENETSPTLFESLWLKIDLQMDAKEDMTLLNTRKVAIKGHVKLYQLSKRKLISVRQLSSSEQTYNTKDAFQFSSGLASSMYQNIVNSLGPIQKRITELDKNRHSAQLKVLGQFDISDFFLLKAELEKSGISLQLQSRLISLGPESSKVLINFRGGKDELRQILLSLRNRALSSDKIIVIPNGGSPWEVQLETVTKDESKNAI